MAFLYVPNGKECRTGTPKNEGRSAELPPNLHSLAPMKNEFSCSADSPRTGASVCDGGGDHAARGRVSHRVHRGKPTAPTRAGTSVDQLRRCGSRTENAFAFTGNRCERAAWPVMRIGLFVRFIFDSLVGNRQTQPLPKEVNRKLVFDRLFKFAKLRRNACTRRRAQKAFLISSETIRDARRSRERKRQTKLDEYFSSDPRIELRNGTCRQRFAGERAARVSLRREASRSYAEHLRLMCDLLVLAFQADVTRVCTFGFCKREQQQELPGTRRERRPYELRITDTIGKNRKVRGSTNSRRAIRVSFEAAGKASRRRKARCRSLHDRLRQRQQRRRPAQSRRLPILLAGRGGGTIKTGRHVRFAQETPVTIFGFRCSTEWTCACLFIGDSTGRLAPLRRFLKTNLATSRWLRGLRVSGSPSSGIAARRR